MIRRHERTESGFTLIELLIVVVIIGILAAIAIPKYNQVKERAVIASLQSDLKKLATKQELYHAEFSEYTADLGAMNYVQSQNVTVTVGEATTQGWSAEANHPNTGVTCAMYYGNAAQVAPAVQPGLVACA